MQGWKLISAVDLSYGDLNPPTGQFILPDHERPGVELMAGCSYVSDKADVRCPSHLLLMSTIFRMAQQMVGTPGMQASPSGMSSLSAYSQVNQGGSGQHLSSSQVHQLRQQQLMAMHQQQQVRIKGGGGVACVCRVPSWFFMQHLHTILTHTG